MGLAVSRKVIGKSGGSALTVLWSVSRETLTWAGNLDIVGKMAVYMRLADKGEPMSLPSIVATWYFPYATVSTGILILLLIWRKELAPWFARETILPSWEFYALIAPIFFRSRLKARGNALILGLIEDGRRISNPSVVPADPKTEWEEWHPHVLNIIIEYHPTKAAKYQSLHGKNFDQRGWRDIVIEEIEWLENLLSSD